MTSVVHGSSPGIQGGSVLTATAPFLSFAPQACICLTCLNSTQGQGRTYFKAWDNRIEYNFPCSPYLCCTCTDQCVIDRVGVQYYDRVPFRSGYYCGLCPLNCCGKPVIYLHKPTFCFCIDISSCFGATLDAAPCSFFGLRLCLCCGGPCYTLCGSTLANGLPGDSVAFMTQLKETVNTYQQNLGINESERAIFDIDTTLTRTIVQ